MHRNITVGALMAAIAGTLTTRVLLAHGDSTPTEVGTITTDLRATSTGAGVQISYRRYRRDIAIAFLRMAWATWTARS